MKDVMNKVKEFHSVFGLTILDTPTIPAENVVLRREALLEEEFEEYMEASENNDIVEIADALGDMVYVIAGTALEYGIPLDKVFNEIHRSNMSKLSADGKPLKRADGKILKGPNYTPPDIETILGEQ